MRRSVEQTRAFYVNKARAFYVEKELRWRNKQKEKLSFHSIVLSVFYLLSSYVLVTLRSSQNKVCSSPIKCDVLILHTYTQNSQVKVLSQQVMGPESRVLQIKRLSFSQ